MADQFLTLISTTGIMHEYQYQQMSSFVDVQVYKIKIKKNGSYQREYIMQKRASILCIYIPSKMITERLSGYYVKFMLMIEVMIKVILMPYENKG